MSAGSLPPWAELTTDVAVRPDADSAVYAQAAARFAAEHRSLESSGGRRTQARAMAAMADLFFTLAEARRARDVAERRLAEEPQDALDEVLAGRPACEVTILRSGASEAA